METNVWNLFALSPVILNEVCPSVKRYQHVVRVGFCILSNINISIGPYLGLHDRCVILTWTL